MKKVSSVAIRWAGVVAAMVCALPAMAASTDPAISRLGLAIDAYVKKDYFTTVHLLRAGGQPVKLRDYVAYYLANAELVTNDGTNAVKDLAKYFNDPVTASPLAGRLGLLYAKALLGQPVATPVSAAKARQLLETQLTILPQPDGDYTLAQAFEATGLQRQAAVYYQRVYYRFPASDLADKAIGAAEKLKPVLGPEYPVAPARQQLDRAKAWQAAKLYIKARQEYASLVDGLQGADRDEAKVGVGASIYLSGDEEAAAKYLAPLRPEGADAAAQRLYYLTEAYRKLNDDASMMASIRELAERYPASPWRLKALITAGNRYLLTQDRDQYVPLYQAAAESFPGDNAAALSQWRVVWAAWLDRSPRRVELLRAQVEKFPNDSHVSDALFFLGRAAEQDSNFAAARAYYECLSVEFPHYYYSGLARERLSDQKLNSVRTDATVRAWLSQATAPHTNAVPDDMGDVPNEATRRRIERGRLLIAAEMTTQAVEELEFGAKQGNEQTTLLAMELSRAMPTPYLAMRVMKKFSGDYLSLPFEKASRAFWEMLFPMSYERALTAHAQDRDLDPFAVAGLIRQESEFNPGARSAYAWGLMQLRPSTGQMLGKPMGIRVSSGHQLLEPDLNIKLGTQYLRSQLNQWDGDWVKTLAAYNAGPTRVKNWVRQYGYDDPAEFIQNIPFSETRDYVQAVLRNGQVYRELYGGRKAILAPEVEDDSEVPAGKITNVAAVSKLAAKKPQRMAVSKKKAAAKKAPAKAVRPKPLSSKPPVEKSTKKRKAA